MLSSKQWPGRVLVILVVCCMHSGSSTSLFDFKGQTYLWVRNPGRACVEDNLLPPSWMAPFVQAHLRIAATNPSKYHETSPPIILQTIPSGRVCRFLSSKRNYCASRRQQQGAICLAISKLYVSFCEDCETEPCIRRAQRSAWPTCWPKEPCTVGGVEGPGFTAPLPVETKCIDLKQLPAVPGAVSRQALLAWEWRLDFSVLAHIIGGFILIRHDRAIQQIPALHALMGSLVPLATAWLVAGRNIEPADLPDEVSMLWAPLVLVTQASLKVTLAMVVVASGGGLLLFRALPPRSSLFVLLRLVVPLCGVVKFANALLQEFITEDPNDLLPTAVVDSFFVLFIGAVVSRCLLASPEDPVGEVSFTIGRDGRRIDTLPAAPLSQRWFGLALFYAGYGLLLFSTHHMAASGVIFLTSVFFDDIVNIALSRSSAGPREHFCEQISQDAFDAQTKTVSSNALSELRNYIRQNPKVMRRVAADRVNNLYLFSESGA